MVWDNIEHNYVCKCAIRTIPKNTYRAYIWKPHLIQRRILPKGKYELQFEWRYNKFDPAHEPYHYMFTHEFMLK